MQYRHELSIATGPGKIGAVDLEISKSHPRRVTIFLVSISSSDSRVRVHAHTQIEFVPKAGLRNAHTREESACFFSEYSERTRTEFLRILQLFMHKYAKSVAVVYLSGKSYEQFIIDHFATKTSGHICSVEFDTANIALRAVSPSFLPYLCKHGGKRKTGDDAESAIFPTAL